MVASEQEKEVEEMEEDEGSSRCVRDATKMRYKIE